MANIDVSPLTVDYKQHHELFPFINLTGVVDFRGVVGCTRDPNSYNLCTSCFYPSSDEPPASIIVNIPNTDSYSSDYPNPKSVELTVSSCTDCPALRQSQ